MKTEWKRLRKELGRGSFGGGGREAGEKWGQKRAEGEEREERMRKKQSEHSRKGKLGLGPQGQV